MSIFRSKFQDEVDKYPNFGECVRVFDYNHILDILTDPETCEEQIRYVTDDLFGDLHANHTPLEKDAWGGRLLLSQAISDLLKPYKAYPLPTYTVETLLPKIKKTYGYKDESILFELLYCSILNQPNITRESLEAEIPWILETYKFEKENSRFFSAVETRTAVIGNPQLSQEKLLQFCRDEESYIRFIASRVPNCPEEGKVARAMIDESASV